MLGNSCNSSKSEIDGFWISAYEINEDSITHVSDQTNFIEIVGDSISFWSNTVPKIGFSGSKIKSTIDYNPLGFEINHDKFDNINFQILSKDSIVVNFWNESTTKTIFKRLEEPNDEISWTPFNESYEWIGNKSFMVNTKFMNNGLYVEYLRKSGQVVVGHWSILKNKKRSFIVLDALNRNTLSIDSITNHSVHVSATHEKKYNYIFKEKHLSIPQNILGEWFLFDLENIEGIDPPLLPFGYEPPKIVYMNVTKDSITTIKNNIEFARKWILGGDGNLMIFPNVIIHKDTTDIDTLTRKERSIRSSILKIDSLSETELIILSDYEILEMNGFERKLKFRRKKTTGNNGYK